MKKAKKVLLLLFIILAGLATIILSIMKIAGNHRSDPADIITYDTNHPFITGRTELIAHRFGAGIAPEESMLAIETCLSRDDISMDIYEFDLRMTKDGYAVVFHDKTLDETTDADGNKPYANLSVIPESLRIMTDYPDILTKTIGN